MNKQRRIVAWLLGALLLITPAAATNGAVTALPPPEIHTPLMDEQFGPNDPIEITWSPVPGAASYVVHILDATTFENAYYSAFLTRTFETIPGGVLPANRRYRVLLFAMPSLGQGTQAPEVQIDVTMEAPQIGAPQDGDELPLGDVTVEWDAVEGALSYNATVTSVDHSVVDFVTNWVSTSYTIPGDVLDLGQSYSVVVTAVPRRITGPPPGKDSQPVTFRTVLGQPQVLFPPNEYATDDEEIQITWTAVPGATSYTVEINDTEVCAETADTTCKILRQDYIPGRMYDITVTAMADSVDLTTGVSKFGIRLLAPALTTPVPSPFPKGPLALKWPAVTGASQYLVNLYEGATRVVTYTPVAPEQTIPQDLLQVGHTYHLLLRSVAGNDLCSSVGVWINITVTDAVYRITGTVVAQGLAPGQSATVRLMNEAGQVLATQSAAASGFAFTVQTPGEYTVRATRDGWQTQEVSVTLDSEAPVQDVGEMGLWFGDVNRDGQVDQADIEAYLGSWRGAPDLPEWDVAGDDGRVNLLDVAVVARNVLD